MDRTSYQSKIIERCNWLEKNDPNFKFSGLKRGVLSKYVFDLVFHDFDTLSEVDQNIIFRFFQVTNRENLNKELKKEKENYGKRISEFLSGKIKKPHNNSVMDLAAILVDLEPRPFKKDYDYSKLDITKVITRPTKKGETRKTKMTLSNLGMVMVFGIVALVCIVIISLHNKKEELPRETITEPQIQINAENIIVSDINRIVPNKDTRFFNNEGEPKIWYASNKGDLELYNTMGIHPQTNQPLQPVTKEVVKTVYIELEKNKKEESNLKTVPYLLNSSLKNDINKKQLSLFIIDEDYKLDTDATHTIKKQLKEKGYYITTPLIASKNLNKEVISNLESLNQDFFKADVNQFVDYICLGTVTYQFSESEISKNLKVCNVSLHYAVISTVDGEEIELFNKTISGIGSNELSAKQNALNKLIL